MNAFDQISKNVFLNFKVPTPSTLAFILSMDKLGNLEVFDYIKLRTEYHDIHYLKTLIDRTHNDSVNLYKDMVQGSYSKQAKRALTLNRFKVHYADLLCEA